VENNLFHLVIRELDLRILRMGSLIVIRETSTALAATQVISSK
jgi:hypothetical protein